jgi:hypothetical protein
MTVETWAAAAAVAPDAGHCKLYLRQSQALLLLLLLLPLLSSSHSLRLHAVVIDGYCCAAGVKVARVLRLQEGC